jgi:LmbE family N-acetylglucosaminyl deacetylase
MPANMLTEAIEQGVPLVVLSPHLDDAVLSCGALLIHAVKRTPVTVATLFTEGGPPPYTLSARRYLHQVGARDAESLYRERRAEDRAVLESMGVTWAHAGLTEAQHRQRTGARSRGWWVGLLPEFRHLYPVYRLHVVSGRVTPGDAGTLDDACAFIRRITGAGPALLLAPLGVGGHVDHVLARTAAGRTGARIAYYSDFPYNQRHPPDDAFVRRNGLAEARWSQLIEAKADLIRAYRTQEPALFRGESIPVVPEVFFFPGHSGNPTEGKSK